MMQNVVLAGVGGQGLLSIAAVLGEAVRQQRLCLKQAAVHGMAQRGGSVQSHVRYSDRPIHSDLIREGTAHLILSLELMEALRYLPFLRLDGALVTSANPVKNIPDYPEIARLRLEIERVTNHLLIDAHALAKDAGTLRCANMVMLGASAPFLGLPENALLAGIGAVFSGKSTSVMETNLRAFRLGREAAVTGGSG